MDDPRIVDFAKHLAEKVISIAKKTIEENGIKATYDFGYKYYEVKYIRISILVDDMIYDLPAVDLLNDFKPPDWEKEIYGFFESSGRFVAYEFLLKNGIDLNDISRTSEKTEDKSGNDTRKRRGRPAKRDIKSNRELSQVR